MTTNTNAKSLHQATVALKLPAKIGDFVTYAHNVITKVTNNPSFPNITATIAALTAALSDLQNAETAALSRTKGAATVRNEKRTVVVTLLRQLRGIVQTAADATPENGASIIESSGLAVRKVPARAARAFTAKPGPVSGTATVTAVSAGPRTFYEWQYSSDGGKTWVNAPSSVRTTSVLTGLPGGTTVQFRYRSVSKAGEGDWSQAVALLVK
jgi:hypothetical protein